MNNHELGSVGTNERLTAIEVVVEIAGSQRALADVLHLRQPSNVSQWVNGIRKVPAKHFDAIEQLTGYRVTRAQLRPDIFGEVVKAA